MILACLGAVMAEDNNNAGNTVQQPSLDWNTVQAMDYNGKKAWFEQAFEYRMGLEKRNNDLTGTNNDLQKKVDDAKESHANITESVCRLIDINGQVAVKLENATQPPQFPSFCSGIWPKLTPGWENGGAKSANVWASFPKHEMYVEYLNKPNGANAYMNVGYVSDN